MAGNGEWFPAFVLSHGCGEKYGRILDMFRFSQLKVWLGEFWWASLLTFLASRTGDVINAFIGLWLVPKYVGMEELGAVMPLQNFAGMLALPISIFAMAFTKQVNVLANAGDYGRMKSMLRGVFVAVGIFFVCATVMTWLLMPLLLERIRIVEGSLGILIIAASFVGAISPIYGNALSGLKRFKVISLINVMSAPVRLVVMLVAMPFRALAGYFVGQASAPAFQICANVFALRRELGGDVVAQPYWTKENIRAFSVYAFFVALYFLVPTFTSFYETVVIRQRLASVDSAAYYMISRFAEIGTYVGATLSTVIFPFASERQARGESPNRLIFWSMAVTLGFGIISAGILYLAGPMLFSFVPDGATYLAFLPEMAVLTVIFSSGITVNCGVMGDIAAGDFRFLWWWVPFHALYGGFLIFVTGFGYFAEWLPLGLIKMFEGWLSNGLMFFLTVMAIAQAGKMVCIFVQKVREHSSRISTGLPTDNGEKEVA